jgi:hypothetical protein
MFYLPFSADINGIILNPTFVWISLNNPSGRKESKSCQMDDAKEPA